MLFRGKPCRKNGVKSRKRIFVLQLWKCCQEMLCNIYNRRNFYNNLNSWSFCRILFIEFKFLGVQFEIWSNFSHTFCCPRSLKIGWNRNIYIQQGTSQILVPVSKILKLRWKKSWILNHEKVVGCSGQVETESNCISSVFFKVLFQNKHSKFLTINLDLTKI